jgi:membrane protease YdiL (CAAX protease family)
LSTVVPGTRGEDAAGSASALASQLRGFGPVGLLAVLVIYAGNLIVPPLSAVFVLVWAESSQTPWHTLGFASPRSWPRTCAIGLALGVAFKLTMKALVMPLFGAPAINPAYHYLAGNPAALPSILFAVIAGAGFGEEVVFRGYLFERSARLFGRGRIAMAATIVITSGLFALAHYSDQGVPGVEQAAVTGLVFGGIFAVTGQLWIPMIAHAAFDLTAVALIYWNWESAVARFFFR